MLLITLGAWYITLMSVAFVFVCVLLILLILIQRPKGGGLAGAFGGAGGSDQAMFGAKAGDALTWITVGCFTTFLLLAMGLTWAVKPGLESDPPAITTPQAPPEAPVQQAPKAAAVPAADQTPVATKATPTPASTPLASPVPAAKPVTEPAP